MVIHWRVSVTISWLGEVTSWTRYGNKATSNNAAHKYSQFIVLLGTSLQ